MKTTSYIQRSIVFFFHLLVICVPFFFTWVNNELFEFNKMLLTYAITALILGLWAARMVTTKKIIWQKTWFDIPLLLFVLSQLASTIFSMHPRTSWLGYYTRFHGGLLSTLTYVALFYAFVANVKASQVKGFIWSVLAAGLGISLYAIPEHFGVSPSCMLISGQTDVSCWVQDVQSRVFGTFGQPNWLAAYVITLLPFSVVLSLTEFLENKRSTSMVALFTTACLFITLLFTDSRSGFVGFLIAAGGFILAMLLPFFVANKSEKQDTLNVEQRTKVVTLGLGIFTLFLVLAGLFGTPFSPSIASLVASKPSTTQSTNSETTPEAPQPVVNRLEAGGTDSGEIRKIVWQGAVDVWKRYPILGSGVETFAYSYYQDRPVEHNDVSEWDFLYNKAHNEFLNYLATTGIVGLATYILLLAFLTLKPLHHALTTKLSFSTKLYAIATASGLSALSVSNFFGFSTVMVTILMVLLPAGYFVLVTDKNAEKSSKNSTSFIQLLGLGVITVITLLAIGQTVSWWQADVAFNTGKQLADAGQLSEASKFAKEAVTLSPNEALFHDEIGQIYAEIAVTLMQQNEATAAGIYAQAAETASNATFQLNPVHLNFYKTQARLFIVLGNIDPAYFVTALNILRQGRELAPTDAKIWYNISLIEETLGEHEQALESLKQTIELRPGYEQARISLAEVYEKNGEYQAAADQYQTVLESIAPGNTIAARKLELLEASISAKNH
jgi:O-antigen ligase/Flp pilus assembly protein TadD